MTLAIEGRGSLSIKPSQGWVLEDSSAFEVVRLKPAILKTLRVKIDPQMTWLEIRPTSEKYLTPPRWMHSSASRLTIAFKGSTTSGSGQACFFVAPCVQFYREAGKWLSVAPLKTLDSSGSEGALLDWWKEYRQLAGDRPCP